MNISFLSTWSCGNFWSDPAKETDRKSSEKVTDVTLDRIASRTKRGSSTASRAISPMRLLLLAGLFGGVRGQGAGPFPAVFDLATLNGVNGFAIAGEVSGDWSGYSVSSAGDVNGDGLADLVIGASRASPSGKTQAGKSYVVFGTRTPFSGGLLDLSTLSGTNGFAIAGEAVGDYSGYSVSSAGDVNRDGFADLVIGAYNASIPGKVGAGKSYVVFGQRTLFSGGALDLSSLNGTSGFAIAGESAFDYSGYSVSSAGDVNGDGLSDLLIGASTATVLGKSNAGKSFVVFGTRTPFLGGLFDLTDLNGTNGFAIAGVAMGEYSGRWVASAGDVNGDGFTDLLIGARYARTGAGKSYLVLGTRIPFSAGLLDLSSLNGTNGFVIPGEAAGEESGCSVASAGDVNGDGLADVVIGAVWASALGKSKAGKSYVVFGTRTHFSGGLLNLSTLNGTNGFAIAGEATNDNSGSSVSSAGDVNGDGLADLVIGASLASPSGKTAAGRSYVVFGTRTPFSGGLLDLSTLNGTNGFAIPGEFAGDYSGVSVSSAGDVNGDGLADLVIGAVGAGKSYVIFGRNMTNSTSSSTPMVTTPPTAFSAPTTFTTPLPGPLTSASSTLLIAGLAAAVAALACSLLGGWLIVKRKQARQSPIEAGTGLKGQGSPALPPGYTSIDAIQQGMDSARAENQYAILPGRQPGRKYDDPRKVVAPNYTDQFDQVSLGQLNAEMGQHKKAELKQMHSNYDDIVPR